MRLRLCLSMLLAARRARGLLRAAAPRRVKSAAAAPAAVVIDDVEELARRYDTLLLDQFGVIHDGKVVYEGSAELVRRLQAAGVRIVVLSNSSKRRRDTIERLQAMDCGVGTWLDRADVTEGMPAIAAFTSGDLVHDALAALGRGEPNLFEDVVAPGAARAYVFGNGDDDDAYLAACGVAAAPVADADYLLARGLFCTLSGGAAEPLAFDRDDACDDVLAAAAARGLPLLVANPDLVRPDGKQSPMPGRLMRRYVDVHGGRAHPVGKPYAHIYAEALRRGAGGDAGRVLAVGDSMAHDVAGANRAGVDSAFVCWGIHAADVGVEPGSSETPLDGARLEAFLATFDEADRPTYVLPTFRV